MKYWNKDKKIRQQYWTKVVHEKYTMVSTYDFLKRWCQLQSSTGKFYNYYGSNTWWFERPEDATWFALNWP